MYLENSIIVFEIRLNATNLFVSSECDMTVFHCQRGFAREKRSKQKNYSSIPNFRFRFVNYVRHNWRCNFNFIRYLWFPYSWKNRIVCPILVSRSNTGCTVFLLHRVFENLENFKEKFLFFFLLIEAQFLRFLLKTLKYLKKKYFFKFSLTFLTLNSIYYIYIYISNLVGSSQ